MYVYILFRYNCEIVYYEVIMCLFNQSKITCLNRSRSRSASSLCWPSLNCYKTYTWVHYKYDVETINIRGAQIMSDVSPYFSWSKATKCTYNAVVGIEMTLVQFYASINVLVACIFKEWLGTIPFLINTWQIFRGRKLLHFSWLFTQPWMFCHEEA